MKSLWSRAASCCEGRMKRLACLIALLPLTGYAQTVTQAKTIDCYFTDSTGGRIELGESICLNVGGRMFTAQCQMSLNVPMWRETQNGCLSSNLKALPSSPLRPNAAQQPVQTFSIYPKI